MNEALAAIHNYYKAFSTLDLDACVPFFTLPCMFIGLRGTFAVANREDLARVLGPTFEALKSKNYQRSEFIEPQLTNLTENAALVRGVAVRYQASGAELGRVAISYMVQQIEGGWKIAVVASAQ
jgi:ketosteroid isomerase-like protein